VGFSGSADLMMQLSMTVSDPEHVTYMLRPNKSSVKYCFPSRLESFCVDCLVLRYDCFKIDGDGQIGHILSGPKM